ncbi:unnamed protein product [Calypogeia fissa]
MAKNLYYHPKRLPANEDRIFKLRSYEDRLAENIRGVKEYQHVMRTCEFAKSGEPKQKFRDMEEMFKEMNDNKEMNVDRRRQELKAMLDSEEAFLMDELKTLTMTLPERRAWLDARARALKANRQEEKERYAQDQLFRAWKESNDDVRMHESKLAVRRAVEGRKFQLQQLEHMKEEEGEKAKMFQRQIAAAEQKKELAYLKEQEVKETMKQEAITMLNEQRALVEKLREEDKKRVKCQMAEMTQRWNAEEEALCKEMTEQRREERQRCKYMMDYNEANKGMQQDRFNKEKADDKERLAYQMGREAAEVEAEQELKASHKREARDFSNYLSNMMAKQKANDLARDAVIKAEEDEEWDKREAAWKRSEDARQSLWCRVHEERQQQLADMEAQRKAEEAEKQEMAERHAAELRALEEERQIRAMDERLTKQELLAALEAQIRQKQSDVIAVKEQRREEYAYTKKTEENYEENLKKVMAALPFPEPFYGRKTTQWYEP